MLTLLNSFHLETLPYSIRVLLESAIRNCDEFQVKGNNLFCFSNSKSYLIINHLANDVKKILDWHKTSNQDIEIPFKPARVLLQDFTGVPCVVDLAAMRDAMVKLGGDPDKINPLCPVDLVIDHSVQVDYSRIPDARLKNEQIEFERNYERFEFLKWGQTAFDNFLIVPPGSGIVHQVNLEYLARVVFASNGYLYPDSVVGTDSHTTMINGLGVVGWGVGGIEAEAVMLGQCISMVLPQVVGFRLTGELPQDATATDLVLTVTQMLRKRGVVGKFVEFFGDGCNTLTLQDRATVSNMAPEYGATIGYFPIDEKSMAYLATTNRSPEVLERVRTYLKAQGLFRMYDGSQKDPTFTGDVLELDLNTVRPSISGPKRPHDRVLISEQKKEWNSILTAKVGFKGFGLKPEDSQKSIDFTYHGEKYTLKHGDVAIAAITSCTNTSNPDVMIGAGLLAKNAVNKGLKVKPYIKTSLSPGSGVVSKYYLDSGVDKYLEKLGFSLAGYGCMTCIGNSGELDTEVSEAITKGDILAAAVLSGNRNFEGRVHPLTRANYLASPMLVVAYALAGTVNIDFDTEPIGVGADGKKVYLKDIWPSKKEITAASTKAVRPEFFKAVYDAIAAGTDRWNSLAVQQSKQYPWKDSSTYIHNPPYFKDMTLKNPEFKPIKNAHVLASFGDFITTDHISPAGPIAKNSPAAKYLEGRGVQRKDFNTYGARRGTQIFYGLHTILNSLFKQVMTKSWPEELLRTSESLTK